jgi:aromatic ring hydroxylase
MGLKTKQEYIEKIRELKLRWNFMGQGASDLAARLLLQTCIMAVANPYFRVVYLSSRHLPEVNYSIIRDSIDRFTHLNQNNSGFISTSAMTFEKLNALSKIKRKESQKWP